MDIKKDQFLAIRRTSKHPNEQFSPDKKVELVKLFARTGNITKSLAAIGVDRHTYYVHLEKDKYLQVMMREVIEQIADKLEEVMIKSGQLEGAQGFRDRKTWLTAYRDRFKDKVEHNHKIDRRELLEYYKEMPKRFKKENAKIIEAEQID